MYEEFYPPQNGVKNDVSTRIRKSCGRALGHFRLRARPRRRRTAVSFSGVARLSRVIRVVRGIAFVLQFKGEVLRGNLLGIQSAVSRVKR